MTLKSMAVLLLLMMWSFRLEAQVTEWPKVDRQHRKNIFISRVEFTPQYTIIDFVYSCPYPGGGWVTVKRDFFIAPAGTTQRKFMIKTKNIPIYPRRHRLKQFGEVVKFRVYFPPLPTSVDKIDVVEGWKEEDFYFFGVYLNTATPGAASDTTGVTPTGGTGH